MNSGYRSALRDPLNVGIVLGTASELACPNLVHSSGGSRSTREIPVSRGVVAAGLLASARHRPGGYLLWSMPLVQHLGRAGRHRRPAEVVWAAALGALLREARRAERWEALA